MNDLNRGTMLVEMTMTDMGIISIALDHYCHTAQVNGDMQKYRDAQQRWDAIYKSSHGLLDKGVRSLLGR